MTVSDDQLKHMAERIVQIAEQKSPSCLFNLAKYRASLEQAKVLIEVGSEWDQLETILRGPSDENVKASAAKFYMKRLAHATACVGPLSDLKSGTETTFKLLNTGAKHYAVLGTPLLPAVDSTYHDLQNLRDLHGANITFDPSNLIIGLTIPDLSVEKFEAIRCAWPTIKVKLDLKLPGHKGFVFDLTGHKQHEGKGGHPGQIHPHILHGSGLCVAGASLELIGAAYREGRTFDMIALMLQLLRDPYESTEHIPDIIGLKGMVELKCDKCETWVKPEAVVYHHAHGGTWNYETDSETGLIAKSMYTCDGCLPKCPVTNKVLKNGGILVNGVAYHEHACLNYGGVWFLKSDCAVSPSIGNIVPKAMMATCVITGTLDVFHELKGEEKFYPTSPRQLVKLPSGKSVMVCCLDLVNEDGSYSNGNDNAAQQGKPWWFKRIGNGGWSEGTEWRKLVAARVASGAAAIAVPSGPAPSPSGQAGVAVQGG